jgi:alpha-L-fucosidase
MMGNSAFADMTGASGRKRDIVGLWKKAAQKAGLRSAVSEHLAPSYPWFSRSHTSDKTGPLARRTIRRRRSRLRRPLSLAGDHAIALKIAI